MTRAKSDFVEIELSAAGVAFAGEGRVVRFANGHFCYTFTAGEPVRVLTSEWSRVLSQETHAGEAIFQVAANSATSELAALKAEEAVLENEIAQNAQEE